MPSLEFELHRLGWKAFEDLVGCVLSAVLGQTYQLFPSGPDGGRDGAFRGCWKASGGEELSGAFVVQCKHTSQAQKTISKVSLAAEANKAAVLVESGLCDSYLLVTNHKVSAELSAYAEQAFKRAGVKHFVIFGADWLCARIAETPKLRRLVPRLYGLGDLTQIITGQAYSQARQVLDALLPDLKTFVPTEAYRKSAHALAAEGFALLLGEPASGKTMIANLLALSAADEWGLPTLMLSSPQQFDELWNPEEPGQFIWVDDAFGSTQYDPARVSEWNHRLLKLRTAISAGARVVFTSRDYIFRAAKSDLKISSFGLFDSAKVTIQVEELTMLERQLILYNHLKFGSQPKEFLTLLIPYLDDASRVRRFLPEIARRLGSPKFTQALEVSRRGVVGFFERPADVLLEIVENLGKAEKSAIALIFIGGGRLPSPVPQTSENHRTLESLGTTVADVKRALNSLRGSLVSLVDEVDGQSWTYRHPTIGDAFATHVAANPELIEIYLAGVSTERLMREATFGSVSIEGAKIVIPEAWFDEMVKRLQAFKPSDAYYFHDPVNMFLATRCSRSFLMKWFAGKEDVVVSLAKSIRALGYDESSRVIEKLNQYSLLSPEARAAAVSQISQIALQDNSTRFMRRTEILTPDEQSALYARVVDETLSNVEDLVRDIRDNWDGETSPDSEFLYLTETLEDALDLDDAELTDTARRGLDLIQEASQEMDDLIREHSFEPLDAEESATSRSSTGKARSVFDDLAE